MKLKMSVLQKRLKKYMQNLRIRVTGEYGMTWNAIMI